MSDRPSSFLDVVRQQAAERPDAEAFTFLSDGERPAGRMTYAELDRRARSIGASLRQRLSPAERVLVVHPPGLEFVAALLGCFYSGAVAVPVHPPRAGRTGRAQARLQSVAADARPAVVLGSSSVKHAWRDAGGLRVPWITTDALDDDGIDDALAEEWQPLAIGPESTALLQYTSGSTGRPRGVMLSHANLLANAGALQACFALGPESRGVSWLPPYHDMGLIGGILEPIFAGFPMTLMTPVAFLQRPRRWLEAIAAARATVSGGPNFAFDLCVRRVPPEQREGLDLSSWQVAFNGAEPVQPATLERFAEAFARCGFAADAFHPCYGLAEATLIVTGRSRNEQLKTFAVNPEALERHQVRPTTAGRRLASNGPPRPPLDITIVEPNSRRTCVPGQVGEIWVRGLSVATGYFARPSENFETFGAWRDDSTEGPYLRTGDLGFLHEGELYVTGRLKDLIIVRGRNHYPQDLEATAGESHPALRPEGCAAFSVEQEGQERLVLIAEIEPRWFATRTAGGDALAVSAREDVCARVRAALAEAHEIEAQAVVLLRPGGLPRTTSGKVQRRACRQGYVDRTLPQVGASVVEEGADRASSVLAAVLARVSGRLPATLAPSRTLASLGIDSVRAIEIACALERELGIAVSPAELLEADSVEALALALDGRAAEGSGDRSAAFAGEAESKEEILQPASFGQEALFFLQRLTPDSAAYNVARAADVLAGLDVDALRRALERLVARHAALRTTLPLRDGVPVQRVTPSADLDFQIIDASDYDEATLAERLAEEAHRPFDLARGPLFRVYLFMRAPAANEAGVLLFVLHHTVTDYWSLAVMARELARLYRAEREGTEAELSPPGPDPGEFARAERASIAGGEGASLWAYWRERLSGAATELALPFDRARSGAPRHRGGRFAWPFEDALAAAVNEAAAARSTTPFVVLLAGLAAVLSRYSGQGDVVIGTPFAGRDGKMADAVGYFVNPLTLRLRVRQDESFEGLLAQARRTVLDALAHASFPFPLLVERLNPARHASLSPIFQVMLTFQRAPAQDEGLAAFALDVPGAPIDLGGLVLAPRPLEWRASALDVAFQVAEQGQGFGLVIEYNADLFEASTLAGLARSWQSLLHAALCDPQRPLGVLPLLEEPERRRVLVEWNATAVPRAAGPTIHGMFEAQAARRPDAPAVVAAGRVLSYRDVDARASRVAAALAGLGVGMEQRVAVCLDRSPELVVAFLAVLKAGGVYLPIDPRLPDERIRWMLRDAGAALVLAQAPHEARLRALSARVVRIDDPPSGERTAVRRSVPPEALAYIIYTSGSTGTPKAAMVEHRGACNVALAQQRAFGNGPGDRVLQFAASSFDVSIYDFLMALLAGAVLHVPAGEASLPGPALVRLCREEAITIATLPPSVLALMPAGELPSLRVVLSAGEACPRELVPRWSKEHAFFNAYGPTETSIWSMVDRCRLDDVRPPIGRPIDNVRAYVLDAAFEPVPPGVAGELLLGGAGVGRGYLGRPALTAERFVPDPFGGERGARLYRTGDRVRWLPDGRLDILGRLDDQVKVRGFRVEPGEIEAALRGHARVRDAAVVLRPGPSGEQRLVGYVACTDDEPAEPAELRAFLGTRLPPYMVPASIVTLPTLPLNASGKIDRRGLVALDDEREARPAPTDARDALGRLVQATVAETFGRHAVGVHDHFFDDLGGSSLTLVRTAARLGDRLGRDVPVLALFEHPTVASLAAALGKPEAAPASRTAAEQQRRAEERRAVLALRGRPA